MKPIKRKRTRGANGLRAARRKPRPIVYGAAWGAWIMRNVLRDLRSGALRVYANGETVH